MTETERAITELGWLVAVNWRESLQGFREQGLTEETLLRFVAVADPKEDAAKWRYFCGCCWRTLKPKPDYWDRGEIEDEYLSDEDTVAAYDWGMVQ